MQRRGLTYGLLIVVAALTGIVASGLPRLHRDGPLPLVADAPSTTAATPTTLPAREPTTMHAMPAKPTVAGTGPATVVVVIGRDRG